jgi:hypothetical protein
MLRWRLLRSTIKEFLTIPHFNFVDANMRPTDDESSSPLAQDKPVAPEHAVVKSAFESVLTAPIQTLFSTTPPFFPCTARLLTGSRVALRQCSRS